MDFRPLQEMMDQLTSWRIPGLAAVGYWGGEKVFSYESGYADVDTEAPMTIDHYVNIYSCSKVATVTAALQLYEKGLFSLDDPLYAFLPEFRGMSVKTAEGVIDAVSPITMQQLFTMTAGFNYDLAVPEIEKAREKTCGRMDTLEVIRCLSKAPLEFEPGTHWKYSLCHDVLAGVVEVISGKKFRDYVKENIFDPLGMTHSFYHNEAVQNEMSTLYRYVNGDSDGTKVVRTNGVRPEGYLEIASKTPRYVLGPEYDCGGAGITSTTADYVKFCAALARSGVGLNGERILTPETITLLKANRLNETQLSDFSVMNLKGYGYGLGVHTRMSGDTPVEIGEFGWGGAAGASVHIDTKNGACLFYTSHMLNPQSGLFPYRIVDMFYSCARKTK